MRYLIKILFIILLFNTTSSAQQTQKIVIVGDSLIGSVTNGESIRRVLGNVVITQGNSRITCDIAIQHIAKNNAELFGNVVVTQDSITLFGKRGFYFGNTKTAYSDSGVIMNDGHVILRAEKGYYYSNEKRAYFYDNVELFDSVSTLYSDRLYYFNKENKAVAAGRVFIADSTSVINADSLISFRKTNTTFAFGNVKVQNPENDFNITGNKLENYGQKKYSHITEHPVLTKIDTAKNGEIDTLLMSAKSMMFFQNRSQKLIAEDSVLIVRGNFSSRNNHTIFYKNDGKIFTFKKENELRQPVLWFDNSQLLADSIYISLKNNELDFIKMVRNASAFSENKSYDYRYDQVSGDTLTINFKNEQMSRMEIVGGVLSIYYVFDDTKPNGLVKVSSERAVISFEKNKVAGINLYGEPKSEYHPEVLIKGKERNFTLPTFVIYRNRPTKQMITKKRN